MTKRKKTTKTPSRVSTYEGRQSHIPSMPTPAIETWEFQYPGTNTVLEVNIPEFTCICPKTGLPDFATLQITYVPDRLCLELKSLKEYMLSFREVGIFHEHVVNKVLADCSRACKPRSMQIQGVFNARGGIQTTAVATLTK
ncbi:MAG TPA: preQ(1) synthase [Fibrobacteria bacterium]|nr:preQ(1) synthase [Fibrobacteria bacterium]